MASYARGRDALRVAAVAAVAIVGFTLLFLYVTNRGLALRRSDLFVRLPSADGLRKGDPVVFRGVAVGEVKKLIFAEEGDVVVRARLMEPVPLTTGAGATLVAVDLFGRQSLVLQESHRHAPRLLDGDTLKGIPPTPVAAQLADLGMNAQRLTGDTTRALLHAALEGAGATSRSMAALSAELQALIAAQRESLSLFSQTATTIAQNVEVATRPDSLSALRDQVTQVSLTLVEVLGRLDTTVASFASLAGSLQNGEGSAGMLMRDPALYTRTASLLESMEELMRDFKANPKRYINVSVF
jgi:phospholipid/cholesterol/gamma-HCH transport system substrate-binding protein